jgi:antitoxin component of MazEF toxin-antitoxin module
MYNIDGEITVYATIKKWGNSYGILLPAAFVRSRNLSENEVVEVDIRKRDFQMKDCFGIVKSRKSIQKIKDELRAGWGD